MAFSIQRAVSDGTMTLLPISIEYFDRDDITVYFDGVPNAYPWSWVGTTERTVAFSPAVPNGVEVLLRRTTDISQPRHIFTLGAQFTTYAMDEDLRQVLQIAQEAKEGGWGESTSELREDLALPSGGTLVGHDPATGGNTNVAAELLAHEAQLGLLSTSAGSGGIGFIQAGAGAVANTVQSKLRESVSVKDFGAVGDGIVDDTAAIQAALNSGFRKVIVPEGVFLHALLTLPSGVELVGSGGTLKMKSGQRFGIQLANPSINSRIENITFDASGMGGNAGVREERSVIATTPGVSGGTLSGLIITGCRFMDSPAYVPGSGSTGQVGHSIQLNYGEATITDNYTNQCGGDCYNFNNGYFIVSNNTAKNVGDGGIAFNNNARGVISGNYLYKCDLGIGAGPEGTQASPDHTLLISSNEIVACGDGINMGVFGYAGREGPRNVKIIGNTISKCKSSGLRYDGSSPSWEAYLIIQGNTINDCGGSDFDGSAGAGRGISIGGCKYVIISSNTLHDNVGTDIIVGPVEYVQVIGNALNAGVFAEAGGTWADFASRSGLIANNTAFGRRLLIQNTTGVRVIGNTLTLGLQAANQGAIVVTTTATEVTISENNFVSCGNAVHLPNLAGWFANDVLDSNKFLNCNNKVVNSPLTRHGDMYVECEYIGVVNASGYFDVSHGTGDNGGRVMVGTAFHKGNSGESIPMSLAFVDGSTVRFTTGVGNAGKVARAWVRYNKDAVAW